MLAYVMLLKSEKKNEKVNKICGIFTSYPFIH